MKQSLRLCLILLICLALPLAGMAGIQAPADPCPMQAAGMASMMDMGQDCCEDTGSSSEHGNPCKPGQECKTASLLQVELIKSPITFAAPVALVFSGDFLPERTPSVVWRPPRA